MALLRIYMALLRIYMAFWRIYRAVLWMYRAQHALVAGATSCVLQWGPVTVLE